MSSIKLGGLAPVSCECLASSAANPLGLVPSPLVPSHRYAWYTLTPYGCMQVGTETEGSLMAPAERTGASAMRPSFGTIGRSGVMSLVDSLVSVQTSSYKGRQRVASPCTLLALSLFACRHAPYTCF